MKSGPVSISAVMVPALGIFEGQSHAANDDLVNRFWDNGNSILPSIGWEGSDEGDTSLNAATSDWSGAGKLTKITAEEAAKYLGTDESEMTPEICSKQYKIAWDATHKSDPINTPMTALEEEIAQLQAGNKELMSRV
jgi:hypothetical protein